MSASRDREILRLAVPAFLALVAEPLFLLSDAAIVGHLGAAELAGLGIAAVVLQTAVGHLRLPRLRDHRERRPPARRRRPARRPHPGRRRRSGWPSGIGLVVTVVGVATTGPLVAAFGAGPQVTEPAETYLRIAFLGTIPLLVMLAATGVLRGLQDTRTPLVVAVGGNALNIVLNLVLVYPVGLGIAGSALGSVLAQVASAAVFVVVVVRAARRHGAPLRPDLPGIRRAAHAGSALVIRTLTLRAALLVTTYAVTVGAVAGERGGRPGDAPARADHLDVPGLRPRRHRDRGAGAHRSAARCRRRRRRPRDDPADGALGRRERRGHRARCWRRSARGSATSSPATTRSSDLLVPVLLVAALGQPIAGVVFVLDGVLIGAGDGRYLAWAGLVTLVVYAPVALAARGVLRRPGRHLGRLLLGLHGRPPGGAGTPGPR